MARGRKKRVPYPLSNYDANGLMHDITQDDPNIQNPEEDVGRRYVSIYNSAWKDHIEKATKQAAQGLGMPKNAVEA